jgi:hypothetical protein
MCQLISLRPDAAAYFHPEHCPLVGINSVPCLFSQVPQGHLTLRKLPLRYTPQAAYHVSQSNLGFSALHTSPMTSATLRFSKGTISRDLIARASSRKFFFVIMRASTLILRPRTLDVRRMPHTHNVWHPVHNLLVRGHRQRTVRDCPVWSFRVLRPLARDQSLRSDEAYAFD